MIKYVLILFLLLHNPLFAKDDVNQTKIKLDKIKKELGLIKEKPKSISHKDKKKIEQIRKELGILKPSKKETKLEKIRR